MKAVHAYRLKLGAAILIGTVSTIWSVGAAVSASVPSLDLPIIGRLALVSEPGAVRAAEGEGVQEALQANRLVLTSAPMTASAWLRIPYLQSRAGAPLNSASLVALENSYAVSPFGPDVTNWRLRFVFEHWSEVSPSLRRQAIAELKVLLTNRGTRAFDSVEIQDPAGRLAARLTASGVEAQRPR
tara:strand:+ start:217 stop:771 length:555 start_codon:yes stop_codon:yes gene_type:complete